VVRRPVVFKWVDPVLGERYRRLEVLPAVTVDPDGPLLVFPDTTEGREARSGRRPTDLGIVKRAGRRPEA